MTIKTNAKSSPFRESGALRNKDLRMVQDKEQRRFRKSSMQQLELMKLRELSKINLHKRQISIDAAK